MTTLISLILSSSLLFADLVARLLLRRSAMSKDGTLQELGTVWRKVADRMKSRMFLQCSGVMTISTGRMDTSAVGTGTVVTEK